MRTIEQRFPAFLPFAPGLAEALQFLEERVIAGSDYFHGKKHKDLAGNRGDSFIAWAARCPPYACSNAQSKTKDVLGIESCRIVSNPFG